MLLPFQRKTFTTSLSDDDAKGAVRAIIHERQKFLFITGGYYSGSMEGKTFTIQRNYLPALLTTRIKGVIQAGKPTLVELRCVPSYVHLVGLSFFAVTFAYFGLTANEMTINGVVKVPSILERTLFALGGVLISAIIFVVSAFVDISRLEGRLREALGLRK